jgi:pimeloyl-[acyl-carrier protein] methyl ester esterase
MRLVLLPGLDGTGDLFAPFIRQFAGTSIVVRYPSSQPLGYAELEVLVRHQLPEKDEFFLLGESFSGPVAISIAAEPPVNLKGVILCCTFASTPQPLLAPLRRLLPLLPAPPLRALEAMLCGSFADEEVRSLLAHALAQVPLTVLKARVSAAATVDVTSKLRSIRTPVLSLRATEDRIIPDAAYRKLAQGIIGAQEAKLVAPHFLLQTVPQQAAAIISEFISCRNSTDGLKKWGNEV